MTHKMISGRTEPLVQIDWTDRKAYSWLTALPLRSFAWEVVRRLPAYGTAWARAASMQTSEEIEPGFQVLILMRESTAATTWGLLGPLEDPRRDARTANVFWDPMVCPAVLPALALPTEGEGNIDLLPRGHSYRGALYEQVRTGRQHVLFAEQGRFLQLDVRGTPVLKAGRLLPDILSSAENVSARACAARQLTDLVRHRALRSQAHPPATQGPRLTTVLQALDGDLAGASRRDIAIALFGLEKVQAGWRTRTMRDKVANAVKYGKFLLDGGYRKFLR
ncbi:MAG: DUF2285 domain-containing protein [Rhodospirillaceae bacterium]|nr:MAG: DUF2285 domain-containing protein [Rhodospirillaceae bacterium]